MFHQNILGRTNYWPLFVIWHFIFYALTPLCYNEVSGFEQEWHVLACTAPAKDIPMQYPTTARPNTYNIHSTTHTIAYVPCDTHICIACPCVVGPGHQMQCTQHSRVFLNGRGNPKSALSGSVLWSWGDCKVWLQLFWLQCGHFENRSSAESVQRFAKWLSQLSFDSRLTSEPWPHFGALSRYRREDATQIQSRSRVEDCVELFLQEHVLWRGCRDLFH